MSSMIEEEAFQFAMQLASASVLPMVLKSVIELGVLEAIAKAGPGEYVSPADMVSQLPNSKAMEDNPMAAMMLDRICRLLASHSVLTCTITTNSERLYGLAPVCKFLIKNEDGVSMAPLLFLNQDKVLMESWYHLKDAVLDGGIPFNKAYGMTAFEYQGKDPIFNKLFNSCMFNISTLIMKKIIDIYDGFCNLTTLVDVGGGIGASLSIIIAKYPFIKAINFDLPHVIQDAITYPGIEYVGGDMFESVPKGDAIFMKWICHDWSDAHCVRFLSNCYKALPDNGKVIVAEFILPEATDSSLATQNVMHMDVLMLAYNPGGKERTEKEFEALAKGAGFSGFRKVCCALNTWVMEFTK